MVLDLKSKEPRKTELAAHPLPILDELLRLLDKFPARG